MQRFSEHVELAFAQPHNSVIRIKEPGERQGGAGIYACINDKTIIGL
jgi:hypothetical protein